MSVIRRAMVYLGLVDDEYDDYEPYEDQPPMAAPARPVGRGGMVADPSDPMAGGTVRTLPRDEPSGVTVTSRSAVVRPITPIQTAKVHVVAPSDFKDAQEVGDRFKGNQPVIVNLSDASDDVRRRLIDFCSGLIYGLTGNMERVAKNVFLLTPANVEVSAEEKRRLQERGLYRS